MIKLFSLPFVGILLINQLSKLFLKTTKKKLKLRELENAKTLIYRLTGRNNNVFQTESNFYKNVRGKLGD